MLLILLLLLINDRCDYLNVRLKGEVIKTFRVSQRKSVLTPGVTLRGTTALRKRTGQAAAPEGDLTDGEAPGSCG